MEQLAWIVFAALAAGLAFWGIAWRRRALRSSPDDVTRVLLDNMQRPCGLVDERLRWTAVSRAFVQEFGLQSDQVVGRSAVDLISTEQRAEVSEGLQRVVDGREDRLQAQVSHHIEGREVLDYELTATPLPPVVGKGRCLVVLDGESGRQGRLGQLRLTERALHAATCAMVISDARLEDYPIVYANAAFESLTGYSAGEVLGRNCRMLNAPEADQPGLEEVRLALREQRRTTVVLRNYRKNGETFWNELTISPIADGRGEITHFLGMQNDVTERMEMSAEHERLLAASVADRLSADRAAKARETMLTVVSHELRSPLNAIRLWTSLLQSSDDVDADLIKRAVEQIDNGVTTQSRIIEDLLDVSRFEGGRLELQREAVDLEGLVREVVQRNEPVAASHGVSLALDAVAADVTVHADPGRLDQALQNLIDNAVKFTPKDGDVRVSLLTVDDQARVIVRDTGAGLAPDQLQDIFEQFWQAEDRDTRTHGGLGLGLNLVKQIIESHDGVVDAHSDGLGQGASISFALPLLATGEQAAGSAATAVAPGERIEGDVLVVDDDQTTVEAVAIGLRMRGYEVRVATGVDEALACIKERRPRMLVSDLMMGGRSGFELVEDVRRDEFDRALDRMPAIAITGRGRPSDRRSVRASGFDRYLQKPVRMDALADAVKSLLESAREAVGARILIASSDRETGEDLRTRLAARGHEVQVAYSAADALALAHANPPEVLIAEAELPDGAGESLLDSIHKESSGTMTALVDAAAAAHERDDVHARIVPGDTDALLRLVARWLTL